MRYSGAIRIHVKGTSQRSLIPEAVIEDLTSEGWQTTAIDGQLPDAPIDGPIEVMVELMDGDHAGWTAHGVITAEESQLKLQGTDPFQPSG